MSKWQHEDHRQVLLAALVALDKAEKVSRAEIEQARKEREIKRVPFPLKKHKPKIVRHESPLMRSVGMQTSNAIKAIYQMDRVQTPVRKNMRGLTKNVGPLDPIVRSQYGRSGKGM